MVERSSTVAGEGCRADVRFDDNLRIRYQDLICRWMLEFWVRSQVGSSFGQKKKEKRTFNIQRKLPMSPTEMLD
jgi:hypothetical protein